jgi:hypothetical protein
MKTRMLTWTGLGSAVVITIVFCLLANSFVSQPAVGQRAETFAPSIGVVAPEPQPVVQQLAEADPLEGSWSYETGPYKVRLDINSKYIDGTLTLPIEESLVTDVDFHGEYSVTADGVLYGVLHSAEVKVNGMTMDVEGTIEAKLIATRLIEQPFAIRVHTHNSTLTVKDVKLGIGTAVVSDDEEFAALTKLFVGQYARANATGQIHSGVPTASVY